MNNIPLDELRYWFHLLETDRNRRTPEQNRVLEEYSVRFPFTSDDASSGGTAMSTVTSVVNLASLAPEQREELWLRMLRAEHLWRGASLNNSNNNHNNNRQGAPPTAGNDRFQYLLDRLTENLYIASAAETELRLLFWQDWRATVHTRSAKTNKLNFNGRSAKHKAHVQPLVEFRHASALIMHWSLSTTASEKPPVLLRLPLASKSASNCRPFQ
ncbi:hypothetical protein FDECE_18648 [Fusarium decemcellulare]|nr:hypothetical protein FDECE_18648 [Fusarium decemcellulare]